MLYTYYNMMSKKYQNMPGIKSYNQIHDTFVVRSKYTNTTMYIIWELYVIFINLIKYGCINIRYDIYTLYSIYYTFIRHACVAPIIEHPYAVYIILANDKK